MSISLPKTNFDMPRDLATCSLLLVTHGSERYPSAVLTLADHAGAIAERTGFCSVRHAALAGGPAPEEVLRNLPGDHVLLVPVFMSSGYFVREAIPERIAGDQRVHVAPAVGENPEISQFIDKIVLALANEAGWRPAETEVILVGHGSTGDPTSRKITDWHAGRICRDFSTVRAAFIEEEPFLDAVVDTMSGQAIFCGYFANAASHAEEDVPKALANARFETRYTGAIGSHAGMREVLIRHINAFLGYSSEV